MCKLDERVSVVPHLMISLVVFEGLREVLSQHVYLPHFIETFGLAQSHQLQIDFNGRFILFQLFIMLSQLSQQ